MKEEARNISTLLAHLYDQPAETPNFRGQTPATPKQIADVIHGQHEPSRREQRREERRRGK